ncbi:MAG: DUF2961 domain-containing protein, partial [Bacteroidetes bacterium]
MKTPACRIFLFPAMVCFSIIFLLSCTGQKIVSLKTLLMGMTDRTGITQTPSPWYKLIQASSYDRKSDKVGGKGWFANDDYTQFSGVDSSKGRKEYILLDSDGPGAIVRWWMTFAGEGSYDGIIRVYIDNTETPVLQENALKLLSGQLLAGEPLSASVSPETDLKMRGHNLYFPIPFLKHCRVTIECDSIRITANSRKPSIYYNICYRQYEKGTKVVSFSKDELLQNAELIKSTNETLKSSGTISDNLNLYSSSEPISAKDSINVNIRSKNSAISKITLKLSAFDTEYALRSTVLKITFDGFQTVWIPVGDFFGTGYKKTTSSTWNSRVDDQLKMESYWMMPFKKSCSVWLINYGDQIVKADLNIESSKYKWRSNSMYFGASWHEYHQIMTAGAESEGGTGKHRDINFADIKGKGVYAGDAVAVFNTVEAWWGEGDEKIFVDGEPFPSSIGTGTEDYYGYAWSRPEIFSHPFIAQPSGSGNFHAGLTINMRYRSLDAIPFMSSISSNIELWHWLPAIINYSLTSYWYVIPPYEINIK